MKEHKAIIAIDQGLSTGCAVRTWDGDLLLFTRVFESSPFMGSVFSAVEAWLADLITDYDPFLVIYESPKRQSHGWRLKTGTTSVIELVCHRRERLCHELAPNTLKKYATGNGNASKEYMISAAKSKGWPVQDDHQADAMWLLDYAENELLRKVRAA